MHILLYFLCCFIVWMHCNEPYSRTSVFGCVTWRTFKFYVHINLYPSSTKNYSFHCLQLSLLYKFRSRRKKLPLKLPVMLHNYAISNISPHFWERVKQAMFSRWPCVPVLKQSLMGLSISLGSPAVNRTLLYPTTQHFSRFVFTHSCLCV